jgi:formylglycine-generating enzyme required for sulfatase activity
MAWIPGGTFPMGSDRHYPEEAPAHHVLVQGFWIDRHAVTTADFRRCVDATGYVTLAERPADAADCPGASQEMLVSSSSHRDSRSAGARRQRQTIAVTRG